MTTSSMSQPLKDWLQQQALAVRNIEQEAHTALYAKKDDAKYRQLMTDKATLLAHLALGSAPFMASCKHDKQRIQETLTAFSQSAANSLQINSVFYMSALLYPNNHTEGEPNNLEKFITSL